MFEELRVATVDDVVALRDLEREANLASLGHVFPPERFPFPDDAVLARWVLVLEDPTVTVLVRDADDGAGPSGGVTALAAYDDRQLRHLAVHPDHRGRGLGTALVERSTAAMAERGATVAELWCLVENHAARRLYERLGWRPTGEEQEAEWPPHPTEMRYARTLLDRAR